MEEDVRTDETTDEPDETTDRREFLKQAGMVGGGALAAIAGLTSVADAQRDIRTGPQERMKPTVENIPMELPESANVAGVEEYREAYEQIAAYTDTNAPAESWAEVFADQNHADWLAGVIILQLRQRFKEAPNLGNNLARLFGTLGAGMDAIREQGVTPDQGGGPRALGNGCGNGCGTGCGSGCMSAITGGFACGGDCGQGCPGVDAAGIICGGGCPATGLKQTSFDREGVATKGIKFKGLSMKRLSAAMRNADKAFDTDLGGPFEREG